MNLDRPGDLRVTCGRGLVPYLQDEVEALGFTVDEAGETSVGLRGTLRDALRLNLHLRTAYHVLFLLERFRCQDGDDLYREVAAFPWEEWVDPDGYVSVVSRVENPTVTNSMFPNLKVKDGLVDRIQDRVGRRPNSGPKKNGLVLTLHWFAQDARLYLDCSGEKLSDRGYRKLPHKAPMRETLAAGVLAAAGYTGAQPLVNPMCGSGTLAIEAALIATGRAPGLLRSNYSALHLKDFDSESWQGLRKAARQVEAGEPAPIIASDRNPRAVEAARKNAQTAGVEKLITFQVCDFADTSIPDAEGGIVLLNPEYGERLGDITKLEPMYERIGDFFKKSCQGYTGYIFTGSQQLAKKVGLRTKRKLPFWNGDIECRLLKYELYRGSVKQKRSESPPPAE